MGIAAVGIAPMNKVPVATALLANPLAAAIALSVVVGSDNDRSGITPMRTLWACCRPSCRGSCGALRGVRRATFFVLVYPSGAGLNVGTSEAAVATFAAYVRYEDFPEWRCSRPLPVEAHERCVSSTYLHDLSPASRC